MKTPNLILTAAVQFALIISIPAFAHTELHGTEEPDHEQVSTEFGGFHSGLIPTRTVEIKMYDSMEFEPAVINVKSNEVIKFLVLNLGELDHEFMFGNQEIVAAHAELMKSHPNVPHDDPFMIHLESNEVGYLVWEFSSPGSFPFVCLIPGHYEAGMRGVLNVGS
ncbi:MAG: cupredoxin family protein [Phycisphaerae bacterium]|nr:cupredoxin family protein [Phycisphaerae bacterium]NIP50630.1 cupredoxin family protein [Phycisphaerae bacterium]NIW96938.1 hypothetical protein [Phycisphaerae bacterium]NIX26350.1 hypothetical protein [Phycisphaerae bacterium]